MWTDVLSIFCLLIIYMVDQLSWLTTISPIQFMNSQIFIKCYPCWSLQIYDIQVKSMLMTSYDFHILSGRFLTSD